MELLAHQSMTVIGRAYQMMFSRSGKVGELLENGGGRQAEGAGGEARGCEQP
jgi:hypothetical protein